MYKNQLQELAQRSCINLPAYACIREGPDHAPRFKATVSFNGEIFESPNYCNTLRQAEHAAAEVALNTLSRRGPSQSLAARILDETGVCKNLLQETAQRAGVSLPVYSTTRSGPGHLPVFTCTVELAKMTFSGEAAKTKKQAEKNAAMAAWSALKQFANQGRSVSLATDAEVSEEQEQNTIAKALAQHFGKEAQQLPQSVQNPSCSVMPIRLRSLSLRDNLQPGSPRLNQSHSGTWTPDLSTEQQQQRHMRNHGHPSVGSVPPPAYRTVGPSRVGSSVTIRDVSAMRDAMMAKKMVERAMGANFVGRHSLVNLQSVPSMRRDRHEVAVPYDVHQRDEDEWLRGDTSKASRDVDNRSDSLEKEHGASAVHGSYNPMSWSGTGGPNWWNTMHRPAMSSASRKTAMPVVLRPAVMVCAAPPRRPEPDGAENEDEAASRQLGYSGGDEGENIDVTRYVWMVEIGLDMLGENVEAFKCSRTFTGPAWGECPGLAGGAESRGSG
ncbi:uncharacterized protein [Physcomitrium patens]|nr:uncharacterized protein LOC112294550 isoform X2 [Physcomitrium patens]XP_024400889.1 uncharacterized protein LOC112294550 isoform X2 [Physcomitrium patens]XP_024400890.1 uncharacterized protein LOC112294550 isoform X2 [Physcomitrium patens]XP_024400891.1 uncharacterized protein LOC112294550 isoform X2 [Physcomitrium patens]|eukprot:XP_024400888.1 uncharacterized protein LOC112294550 isoform X2 [Physcomitrella patens]